MTAICLAESSGNPRAVNPGTAARPEHSVGLWQINIRAHGTRYGTEEDLKNPITNAEAALDIYRRQGLRAWGAYTDGRYKQAGRYTQAANAYSSNGETQTPSQESARNETQDGETVAVASGIGILALIILGLSFLTGSGD